MYCINLPFLAIFKILNQSFPVHFEFYTKFSVFIRYIFLITDCVNLGYLKLKSRVIHSFEITNICDILQGENI